MGGSNRFPPFARRTTKVSSGTKELDGLRKLLGC